MSGTRNAEDECQCGDYLYQHEEWSGKCQVCGDSKHPADGCQSYRLAFRKGPAMSVSGNEWVPPPGRIDLLEVENAELERHLSDSNAVSGDLQMTVDRLEDDLADKNALFAALQVEYRRLKTRAEDAEADADKLALAVQWLIDCVDDPKSEKYTSATVRSSQYFLEEHRRSVSRRTKEKQ